MFTRGALGQAPEEATPAGALRRRFRRRLSPLSALVTSVLLLSLALAPAMAQDELSDDLIYDRVIRTLVNDRQLKTNALEVSVENRVVTVTGEVKNEKLRRRVEKVVKKVKGVKKVINQVRVRK